MGLTDSVRTAQRSQAAAAGADCCARTAGDRGGTTRLRAADIRVVATAEDSAYLELTVVDIRLLHDLRQVLHAKAGVWDC